MTYDELVAGVHAVCDVVRTALGPFGANKLLLQADGTVTATASSTELLSRFDVDDPAVTLLETAASGFDERYGDGTGTVVTLAGALLREADDLDDQGLHPTAIERGYRAALDVALDVVDEFAVRGDSDRLQRVFENLFRNSIEHGGREVTVRVGSLDDGSGFYVEDDGAGIPEGERADVFEHGYTTSADGTGFGLPIVEEIVDAHGWSVAIADAEHAETGARFEITGVELTEPADAEQ